MLATDASSPDNKAMAHQPPSCGTFRWLSVSDSEADPGRLLPEWAQRITKIGHWIGQQTQAIDCVLAVPTRNHVVLWIALGFLAARLGRMSQCNTIAPMTEVKILPDRRSRFVRAIVEGTDPSAPHLYRVRHLDSPTNVDSLPREALITAKGRVTLETARRAAAAAAFASEARVPASSDDWLALQDHVVIAGDVEKTTGEAEETRLSYGRATIRLRDLLAVTSDSKAAAVTRLVSSHAGIDLSVGKQLSVFNGPDTVHLLEQTHRADQRGADLQSATVMVVTESEFIRLKPRIADALVEANGTATTDETLRSVFNGCGAISAIVLSRRVKSDAAQ